MRRHTPALILILCLAGCAPMAARAPHVPVHSDIGVEEIRPQVGMAFTGASSGSRGDGESWPDIDAFRLQNTLWYLGGGRFYQSGVVLFSGASTTLGAGYLGRGRLSDGEVFHAAIDFEVGWFWLGFGLPLTWRLTESVSFFARPSASAGLANLVQMPVGMTFELGDRVVISPSVGGLLGTRLDADPGVRLNESDDRFDQPQQRSLSVYVLNVEATLAVGLLF